jgi:hypothetical protein
MGYHNAGLRFFGFADKKVSLPYANLFPQPFLEKPIADLAENSPLVVFRAVIVTQSGKPQKQNCHQSRR